MAQRSEKRGRDMQRAKHWNAVVETLGKVKGWMAVRWVFAQSYNAHAPLPCQEGTHERAREVCTEIIRCLGGDILEPPPKGLRTNPHWAAFVEAAIRLEPEQQAVVMRKVVDEYASTFDCTDPIERNAQRNVAFQAQRLHSLMVDMRIQQAGNDQGWVPGKGFTEKKRRAKKQTGR